MAGAAPTIGNAAAPNTQVREAHVDDADASTLDPVSDAIEERPDDTGLPADPDAPPATPVDEDPTISALKAKPSIFDQERDAIGERYAARRAAANGEKPDSTSPAGDTPAVGQDGQPVAGGDKPAGTITPAAAPSIGGPQATEPSADRRHKITVNGVDVEVSEADMIRMAQRTLSGDPAGLPALREAEQAAPATTDQRNDPARPSRLKIDPARLTAVVERLQVGTAEDGAEALHDLLAEALDQRDAAQAATPDVVRQTVKQALSEDEASKEANKALTAFAARFKVLASDDDMATAVLKQTSREIISDFKRIGLPADQIARAEREPAFMIDGYRQLRTQVNPATGQPWGLRSYDEILNASGETVAKKFNVAIQPVPGAEPGRIRVSGDRAAAKDGLSTQPRSAGLPADAGRLAGNENRNPASRTPGRSIVDEERRARGFA